MTVLPAPENVMLPEITGACALASKLHVTPALGLSKVAPKLPAVNERQVPPVRPEYRMVPPLITRFPGSKRKPPKLPYQPQLYISRTPPEFTFTLVVMSALE